MPRSTEKSRTLSTTPRNQLLKYQGTVTVHGEAQTMQDAFEQMNIVSGGVITLRGNVIMSPEDKR